jgi:hypothetical protein
VGGQPLATSYGFDNSSAVNTISYSDFTPAIAYTYDRLGRRATVVQNGMTATFICNPTNELLSESFSGGPLDALSVTNGYDQYLRRTILTLNSQPSTPQPTATTPPPGCAPLPCKRHTLVQAGPPQLKSRKRLRKCGGYMRRTVVTLKLLTAIFTF